MKRGNSILRRPSGRPGKICLSHMEVPSGNSEYGLKTKNLGRTVTGTAHQCSSPVCKVTNLKTFPFSAGVRRAVFRQHTSPKTRNQHVLLLNLSAIQALCSCLQLSRLAGACAHTCTRWGPPVDWLLRHCGAVLLRLTPGTCSKRTCPELFPLNCSGNKDGGTENCAGHKRPRHSGSYPTVRSVCTADALASAVSGEFPLPQNTGFRFPYPGIFPVQRDRRHPSRCGRKHGTGKERTRNAVTGNGA